METDDTISNKILDCEELPYSVKSQSNNIYVINLASKPHDIYPVKILIDRLKSLASK